MSKYTTEVRFICEHLAGYDESVGETSVNTVIANSIDKIFDNFPIFDESYRTVLEKKIIKHYYTREIAHETYGLWRLKLNTKLEEIMPYYNKLYNSELLEYNPLYSHDITRVRKNNQQTTASTSGLSHSNTQSVDNASNKTNGTNSSVNTDLYSDTPQGQLQNLETGTYLTNARQTKDNDISHNEMEATNSSTSSGNTINKDVSEGTRFDDYIEKVSGYQGVNPNKYLEDFRKTFLNIDLMIIKELEELFFQLW